MKTSAKPTKAQIEDAARKYPRFAEYSVRDKCYVGSAPPLVGRSCHGETVAEVMQKLETIVRDWVEDLLTRGEPLPDRKPLKDYSGKFVVRIRPELHQAVAIKAELSAPSLNAYVEKALESAVKEDSP